MQKGWVVIKMHLQNGWFFVCLSAIVFFAVCLTCFCLASQTARKKRREKARVEARKKEIYTLPNRENSFIKERLLSISVPQTSALCKDGKELRLVYVRGLLQKIKGKSLTPSERVQVDGISRYLTAFAMKDEHTCQELREVNERFSELIKLSAKYAI